MWSLLITVRLYCMFLFTGSLTQCNYGDVRLVNGPASNEGVVEVCIDAHWGTICADHAWNTNDATVICRQLGYPYDNLEFGMVTNLTKKAKILLCMSIHQLQAHLAISTCIVPRQKLKRTSGFLIHTCSQTKTN